VKKVILIQIPIILIGGMIAALIDTERGGLSYLFGASVVLINLLLHSFVWTQMFRKKLVALGMFIIVFKYAILGAIIYTILRLPWMDSRGTLWFCAGVGSLMLSAVIFALSKEENVI
jgi:hypothetical protein